MLESNLLLEKILKLYLIYWSCWDFGFTRSITLPVGQCLLIVCRNAKLVREKFLHLQQRSHFSSECLACLDREGNWRGGTNRPFQLASREMGETRGNGDINVMVKCDWTILLQEKVNSCAAYIGQFSWFVVVCFLFIREGIDCG